MTQKIFMAQIKIKLLGVPSINDTIRCYLFGNGMMSIMFPDYFDTCAHKQVPPIPDSELFLQHD